MELRAAHILILHFFLHRIIHHSTCSSQGFVSSEEASKSEPPHGAEDDGLGLDDMAGLTEEIHALLELIEERGKKKKGREWIHFYII